MTKKLVLSTLAFLALVGVASFRQSVASPSVAVFSGTSPCDAFAKPFLRIPTGENCDRIKWQLSLDDSGKYVLKREYGYHLDNRTYLPRNTTSLEGVWKTVVNRVVLDHGKPNSLSFALIDQNLLHPLDATQNLAIGHSGASYTLSRERKSSALAAGNYVPATEQNLATQTVFSGRSPCRELAKELNRAVPGDCFKLKWKLTLNRDPKTLAPTTYQLKGTLYHDDVRSISHPREGKWTVIKGTKTNPNAVVYQLDAFGTDGPIRLLKADDNVLFFLGNDGSLLIGNEDFSYTLNRDD